MGFKDEVTSAFADVFFDTDTFGVTVTYTPVGGSDTEITAIVMFGFEDKELDRSTVGDRLILRVNAADIARPRYRDKVRVTMPGGGVESWWVSRILEGNGFAWKLECTQDKRPGVP